MAVVRCGADFRCARDTAPFIAGIAYCAAVAIITSAAIFFVLENTGAQSWVTPCIYLTLTRGRARDDFRTDTNATGAIVWVGALGIVVA